MDIGMLWYDDTRRPLGEKIARAVEHYKTKYGAVPTVCFVNPAMLKDDPEVTAAAGVQLRSARHVLVNHLWIGVGEAAARSESSNGRRPHRQNGKRARRANT